MEPARGASRIRLLQPVVTSRDEASPTRAIALPIVVMSAGCYSPNFDGLADSPILEQLPSDADASEPECWVITEPGFFNKRRTPVCDVVYSSDLEAEQLHAFYRELFASYDWDISRLSPQYQRSARWTFASVSETATVGAVVTLADPFQQHGGRRWTVIVRVSR